MKVNIHSGSQPLHIPPRPKMFLSSAQNIYKTAIDTLVNENIIFKNIMDAYINIKPNV